MNRWGASSMVGWKGREHVSWTSPKLLLNLGVWGKKAGPKNGLQTSEIPPHPPCGCLNGGAQTRVQCFWGSVEAQQGSGPIPRQRPAEPHRLGWQWSLSGGFLFRCALWRRGCESLPFRRRGLCRWPQAHRFCSLRAAPCSQKAGPVGGTAAHWCSLLSAAGGRTSHQQCLRYVDQQVDAGLKARPPHLYRGTRRKRPPEGLTNGPVAQVPAPMSRLE